MLFSCKLAFSWVRLCCITMEDYWRKIIRKHVLSKEVKGNHQRPWVPSKFVQGNSSWMQATQLQKNCNIMITLSFIKSVNNVILVPSFFMRVPIKLTESLVLFSTSTRIHAIFVRANIYEIFKRAPSWGFEESRVALISGNHPPLLFAWSFSIRWQTGYLLLLLLLLLPLLLSTWNFTLSAMNSKITRSGFCWQILTNRKRNCSEIRKTK